MRFASIADALLAESDDEPPQPQIARAKAVIPIDNLRIIIATVLDIIRTVIASRCCGPSPEV